jgi:hypothetical protein
MEVDRDIPVGGHDLRVSKENGKGSDGSECDVVGRVGGGGRLEAIRHKKSIVLQFVVRETR